MSTERIDVEALRGHTPGPWKVLQLTREVAVESPCGRVIYCVSRECDAQVEADGCLIAAAPALLAEVIERRARDAATSWQPIETAPKDGTAVLVGNEHGCWVAQYKPVYCSGYRPDDPWCSLMLNHEHMRKAGVLHFAPPTHWMPLPYPPAAIQGAQP